MKAFYIVLFLYLMGLPILATAQILEVTYEGKRDTLVASKVTNFSVEEPLSGSLPTFLTIRLDGRLAGTSADITLIELGDGTASAPNDYRVITPLSTKTFDDSGSQFFTVGINIGSDNNIETNEILLFNLTYLSAGVTTIYPISITIKDKKDPTKAKPDSALWSFKIITGSNFDFFDAPTFKNFAGDLNIFAPGIWKIENKKKEEKEIKLGLSFGIYSYNYFESDSSKGRTYTERYLINPNISRIIVDTTRYIRDSYALNSKTTYANRGIYLHPIIALYSSKDNDIAQLYANIHLEIQGRTEVVRPTRVAIRKDSMFVTQADISQGVIFKQFPDTRADYNKRIFYDSNVGVGLPLKLNVKNKISLYLHPTLGYSFYEDVTLRSLVVNGIERIQAVHKTARRGFYMFKGQIITMVAPIDIALGWEYRKVALRPDFLAMYLGAAISLDKLKR